MEHLAAADHEHSTFIGDVAEGRLPGCPGIRRRCQMDLLAVRVQRLTCKRHQVLPAEQSAYTSSIQFDCCERASISLPPDGPLLVRGHQLAVMQQQFAVGVEYKKRVVQCSAAVR